jgi:hypothetical protein
LGKGLRGSSGDDRGSSTRASPVLSGGSTLSVARVLVQTALPRESCSTLPLGPFCCRLKSGRRIFTVSTMPDAPVPQGYSLFEPKTRVLNCPPTWSQNGFVIEPPMTVPGGRPGTPSCFRIQFPSKSPRHSPTVDRTRHGFRVPFSFEAAVRHNWAYRVARSTNGYACQ